MSVLKKGNSLVNPGIWTSRANATALLIILIQGILQISKAFGYEFEIDAIQVQQIADILSTIGVGAIALAHTASNKEAGHG